MACKPQPHPHPHPRLLRIRKDAEQGDKHTEVLKENTEKFSVAALKKIFQKKILKKIKITTQSNPITQYSPEHKYSTTQHFKPYFSTFYSFSFFFFFYLVVLSCFLGSIYRVHPTTHPVPPQPQKTPGLCISRPTTGQRGT